MEEISLDKIQVLLDRLSVIIENMKEEKAYLFDVTTVKEFIDFAVPVIYNEIKKELIK